MSELQHNELFEIRTCEASPLSKGDTTDDSPGTETIIMDAPLKIFEELKLPPLMFKCPEDE